MDKTYLKVIGANTVAEHDLKSSFTFELQDQTQVKMGAVEGIGKLYLGNLATGKVVREIPIAVSAGIIEYTIDDLLQDGYYGVSCIIDGQVFPSSSVCEIRIRSGNEANLVEEIQSLGLTKIQEEAFSAAWEAAYVAAKDYFATSVTYLPNDTVTFVIDDNGCLIASTSDE